MRLSKIILYSDAKGRGVKPDACVEVSQRLTIMRDGHIWFIGYNYGDGFNSRRIIRRKRVNIGQEKAETLLELLKEFFLESSNHPSSTNRDWWRIQLIDEDGNEYNYNVSIVGEVILKEIDLTQYMRNIIPIDDMYLFGNKDSHNLT